jgi:hypothetical protein
MKRKYLIGLGLVAGAAGAAALGHGQIATIVGRVGGTSEVPQAKQWPFDSGELRTLMGRVAADQQAIIANAETPEERTRAEAFARYYEGRRAAAGVK